MRALIWRWVRRAHQWDFAWFLPVIARLPLRLAYGLSSLRGYVNAIAGRDWRSVGLGFRHIRRQSRLGYAELPGDPAKAEVTQWVKDRFRAEARDEFEARLIAAGRVAELECTFTSASMAHVCNDSAGRRGLVLLTPHFDSFFLGVAFLARSGAKVNLMSSTVTHDPRVASAVREHFSAKYRGLEAYLNGGQVLDMEMGLRPFYRMLERRETLVILGDAPVLPQGVAMTVDFLGGPRVLAGGALRLAEKTDSDLGGFLCRCVGPGRYTMEMCDIGPARDPQTVAQVYQFFSDAILDKPGAWWAADLLPAMPLVKSAA